MIVLRKRRKRRSKPRARATPSASVIRVTKARFGITRSNTFITKIGRARPAKFTPSAARKTWNHADLCRASSDQSQWPPSGAICCAAGLSRDWVGASTGVTRMIDPVKRRFNARVGRSSLMPVSGSTTAAALALGSRPTRISGAPSRVSRTVGRAPGSIRCTARLMRRARNPTSSNARRRPPSSCSQMSSGRRARTPVSRKG